MDDEEVADEPRPRRRHQKRPSEPRVTTLLAAPPPPGPPQDLSPEQIDLVEKLAQTGV
jgi:hypothetical protein